MKVAHWTLCNGSGMHRMAEEISAAECALGVDSLLVPCEDNAKWESAYDADIHVNHTHLPDIPMKEGAKTVWIGHGTIEHCFQNAVEEGTNKGYGAGDTWMLVLHWLKRSDALVTFWPRQQELWQTMVDKGRTVHCVPMGVNTDYWQPIQSQGKYAGTPSVLTAENCHYIKWPLDLILMWPLVTNVVKDARLHLVYLPRDQHRWWAPLMFANGAAFKTYMTGDAFAKDTLRNAFCSTDYYCGLVRYGDVNRVCLEAKASGAKVISFRGNEYADFWISEGDQRLQKEEMVAILRGDVAPRETKPVPHIRDTAAGMIQVYTSLL